jgi:hypothetical protein
MYAAATDRVRLDLDLRNEAVFVTFNADRSGVLVRISSPKADLTLDLGPEAVAQLKQALAWAGDSRPTTPRVRAANRLSLVA